MRNFDIDRTHLDDDVTVFFLAPQLLNEFHCVFPFLPFFKMIFFRGVQVHGNPRLDLKMTDNCIVVF